MLTGYARRSITVFCLLCLGSGASAQTTSSNLLGPVWGVRPWLGQYGISFGLSEISEVFGNATGGVHRGADYDGLTTMSVGVDLGRVIGLSGGTLNASAFQIHGRSLSADNLDNINTISGIEASRATRLWELWYDQQFADGAVDVKVGQQSLDQEYMTSASLGVFANTMFGWPALPSYDLYAGGPAYPLSSLGVRLRGNAGPWTGLFGVYDDNPAGGSFNNDPQTADASGALFSLKTGALFIAEVDYALGQPSQGQTVTDPNQSAAGGPLPGLYKLGAWFDSAAFPDQRFDDQGLMLASPLSDGNNRLLRHNFSIYGVADQTIWRPDPNLPRALNLFTRLMGAPGDRNLIDFSANLGLVLKDPLPGRDNDTLGLAGGFTKIGRYGLEFDQDVQRFNPGVYSPLRSSESYLELTYQYQPVGWLMLQPDLQYVFMPGAGIVNPSQPNTRISNEFVLGVRSNIIF